jgi:hypothetical protein
MCAPLGLIAQELINLLTIRIAKMCFVRLLCLAATVLLGAETALASTVPTDYFTLTEGTNTLSFSLPAQPVITVYVPGSHFVLDSVPVDVNGTTSPENLIFWNGGATPWGGGLAIVSSTNDILVDTNGSTSQLYTGSEYNPTFLTGLYEQTGVVGEYMGPITLEVTDSSPSPSPSPVPEPSSLFLLSSGIMGCLGVVRKKLVK